MGIAQKRKARFGGGGHRADVLPPPAPAHPLCARTSVGRVPARAFPTPSIAALSGPVIAGAFWPGFGGGGEASRACERRVRSSSGSGSAFRIRDDVLAVRVRVRRTLVEHFFFGRTADPSLVIGLDARPGRAVFLSVFLALFSTSRSRGHDREPTTTTTANGSRGSDVQRPRLSGGGGGGGGAGAGRAAGGRAPESAAAPFRLVAFGFADDAHDVPADRLPLAAVHVAPHQALRHGARVQRRGRRRVRGRPARPPVRA